MAVATRNSIVIKKSFDYRGGVKTWTNRYHFEGAVPSDDSAWTAFADLIVAAEKAIYSADVTIVEAIGFDIASASATNPDGIAVFTKTYTTAGTWTPAGGKSPGDAAAYLRYGTDARSTKNHPVYLSNYFHGCYGAVGDPDTLETTQKAAIETYADHWLTGFTADGSLRERCGPRGAAATSRTVAATVRHRDFPS
jgi:hypothetical protein